MTEIHLHSDLLRRDSMLSHFFLLVKADALYYAWLQRLLVGREEVGGVIVFIGGISRNTVPL